MLRYPPRQRPGGCLAGTAYSSGARMRRPRRQVRGMRQQLDRLAALCVAHLPATHPLASEAPPSGADDEAAPAPPRAARRKQAAHAPSAEAAAASAAGCRSPVLGRGILSTAVPMLPMPSANEEPAEQGRKERQSRPHQAASTRPARTAGGLPARRSVSLPPPRRRQPAAVATTRADGAGEANPPSAKGASAVTSDDGAQTAGRSYDDGPGRPGSGRALPEASAADSGRRVAASEPSAARNRSRGLPEAADPVWPRGGDSGDCGGGGGGDKSSSWRYNGPLFDDPPINASTAECGGGGAEGKQLGRRSADNEQHAPEIVCDSGGADGDCSGGIQVMAE